MTDQSAAGDHTVRPSAKLKVRLRAATEREASTLADLHRAAFGAISWDAASMGKMLSIPGTEAMLALCGEGGEQKMPCGMVMGRLLGTDGEILTLAVPPAFRRRGIGSRLLSSLMAGMAMQGAERIFLEVAADNAAAIALYERLRFEIMGKRPKYYASGRDDPVDALLMVHQFNCGCGG